MSNMNRMLYLNCILCFVHLMITPILCIKINDYGIFLIVYALLTAGIIDINLLTTQLAGRDGNFAGGFGSGLIIGLICFFPIWFTAPIAILVKTIYYLIWLADRRQQGLPPPDSFYSIVSQSAGELINIVVLSTIIAITFAHIARLLVGIASSSKSHSKEQSARRYPLRFTLNLLQRPPAGILINAVVAEIVWQDWTHRISLPDSLLVAHSVGYHVVVLILLIIPPTLGVVTLRRNIARRERACMLNEPVRKALEGLAVHPAVAPVDLQSRYPVTLAAFSQSFDEPHMSSTHAVWLDYFRTRKTGPQLGVFRFTDASTRSIQLPRFPDSRGDNDNVKLFLLKKQVVALCSTIIAVIDLDTGAIRTTPLKSESHSVFGFPQLVLLCEHWMVFTWEYLDTDAWVMDLSDFSLRPLKLLSGDNLCGVTTDAVVVKNWIHDRIGGSLSTADHAAYFSIDLESLTKTQLPASQVWWMPQANDTVEEDLRVAPDDQIVKVRNLANGTAYQVKTSLFPTNLRVTGDCVFWNRLGEHHNGSKLLRSNVDTGAVERVLNAPICLDRRDFAFNGRYFLNIVIHNGPFDLSDNLTYPYRLELVPMLATPLDSLMTSSDRVKML